jgi:hypothetical protein
MRMTILNWAGPVTIVVVGRSIKDPPLTRWVCAKI